MLNIKDEYEKWVLEYPLPKAEEDPIGNARAVSELLYDVLCWPHTPSCMEHAGSGIDYHSGCLRCEALKRIEDSGWERGTPEKEKGELSDE